ncbi:MAG: hypothetical protein ABW252_26315 [Polyangiales bacterium]
MKLEEPDYLEAQARAGRRGGGAALLRAAALAWMCACGGDDPHATGTDPSTRNDGNQPDLPRRPRGTDAGPSPEPEPVPRCDDNGDCAASAPAPGTECVEPYCDLDDATCKVRPCRGGPATPDAEGGLKDLTFAELAQLGVALPAAADGAPRDMSAPSGVSLLEMPTSLPSTGDATDLGKGFDTLRMQPRGWCVKNDKLRTLPGAQDTRWNMVALETMEAFKSVMNLSASASFSAGLYGGDASLSLMQAASRSRFGLFLVSRVDVDNPPEQLAEYKLTDEVVAGLQRSSFDFRQTCGDAFVLGRITGGTFIGTLDIGVETEEEKTALSAKLGLIYAGGVAKVSVGADAAFEELKSRSSTKATIIRQGGTGRLLPGNDVSIASLREASLAFPELIRENGGTPWVKRYLIADYGVIVDRPAIPPIVDAQRRRVLADLDRLWNLAWQVRKDADYVLENPTQFVSPDLEAIKQVSAKASKALDEIVAVAAACFQDAAQCRLVEVDLDWSATRVPSCKTDVSRDCPAAYAAVGVCKVGRQSCTPSGTWNACEGAVAPQPQDSCREDLTCDGRIESTPPSCACGQAECRADGTWSACSEPREDCGECGRRVCNGGQAWSACMPAAERACSFGRTCGGDGACLPHRFELAFENINDDAYVWRADGSGTDTKRALVEVHRGSGVNGSRAPWQLPDEGRYIVRFGNGGCFGSSGTVRLLKDGQEVGTFAPSDAVRACGWWYRLVFDVSFTTGEVVVVQNDTCAGLPTDSCGRDP